MQGYEISALSAKTKELIKTQHIDVNNDDLINIDNGELANLLSATGKNDINDLRFDSWYDENKKSLENIGVIGVAMGFMGVNACMAVSLKTWAASIGCGVLSILAMGAIFKSVSRLVKCIDRKNEKLSLVEGKDNEIIKEQVQLLSQAVEQPTDNQEIKIKFEEGFKELGILDNTELKEYIPQRGEYWISILKAKYGVDDLTAQKMANKIKEMVYDDSKASKQTPVMYLPGVWTFEGKTYYYDENIAVAKTENYSDNVKTEMGKMSKDIKYE